MIRKCTESIFIFSSRLMDVLPAQHKWKIARYLPRRLSRPFMQYSRAQIFSWRLNDVSFNLLSSPEDDYFRLSYENNFSSWDVESIAKWCEITQDANVCIDIGAYTGIYSILASRQGGSTRVISVEPNKNAFYLLSRNLELNHRENVEKIQKAIHNSNGIKQLVRPTNRKTSSSVQLKNANELFDTSNWENEPIETITLDAIIQEVDLGNICAIKIDVEGLEIEVLQGASAIIKSSRPAIILECLELNQLNKINEFLGLYGYQQGSPLDGEILNNIHPDASSNPSMAKNYLFLSTGIESE